MWWTHAHWFFWELYFLTARNDRTLSWSCDWLRFGERATDRQCLLRSPEAVVAYCDRSFWLVVGHRTIGHTRGRAINNDWRRSTARYIISLEFVRLVVAINDRLYDKSWPPRSIVRSFVEFCDRNISTFYHVSEQSIGGTTGRKVARPVLNMTIDLVATHDICDQSYDLCDQSYVLSTIGPRFKHFSIAGRS